MKITELEERMKGHARITKSIISAPFDLKTEINKVEGKNMRKPKNIIWLKRASTIAAVVTICAVTVVSAGAIKGMFKDVYTQAYVDAHPELLEEDIEILKD